MAPAARLAVFAPALVGVKVTSTVHVAPPARVVHVVASMAKSAALAPVSCVVMGPLGAWPVLVTVYVWVAPVAPATMVP